MAFNLNSDDDEITETHDINVTPFIDVILVLLIIFMVAAPLATVDINVDLPASNAAKQQRTDKPVYLTIKDDLSLALGKEIISSEALEAQLNHVTKNDKETRIFLRADKVVEYGELMKVMNDLRKAGYLKIALVGIEGVNP